PEYIVIEPVDPGVYYVPVYDPYVAYGPWLWPAYRPFYWYPPGYVVGAAVVGFGVGFAVGSALWCHYNWGYYGGGYGWRGGGPGDLHLGNLKWLNCPKFRRRAEWLFRLAFRRRPPRHRWIPERVAAAAIRRTKELPEFPKLTRHVARQPARVAGPVPHPRQSRQSAARQSR